MNNQKKKTAIFITITIIAIISILLNIVVFSKYAALLKNKNMEDQLLNSGGIVVEEKKDNEVNTYEEDKKEEIVSTEEENKELEKEYIYKYIEGKEKQVLVEKEVEKTIEVPASSTDASVTYIDVEGNEKTIELPSGTTINFSAGEHGAYDSVPSLITLTNNQQLDITDSSYNPSKIEVNYIFKGFSYSGNTMTCMYSLASNTVNVECRQVTNSLIENNTIYIKQDYIESTGSQWIDTGLSPIANRRVEIDCIMTQPDDSAPVFFGAVNSSTGRFDVYAQQNKAWYRTNNSGASATLDYTTGDRAIIGLYSTGTIKHYFKNGVEYTQSESLNSGYGNIYIMRRGMSGDNFAHMKLYGFKIYDGSSLTMELIPVVRVSDGKAGMLNRNNGNLLTNGGSGNFEHPNIILMPGNKAGKVIASGTYETEQSVTLTAMPNAGYTFVGWSDGSTNQTRSISIGDNAIYTALFEQEH